MSANIASLAGVLLGLAITASPAAANAAAPPVGRTIQMEATAYGPSAQDNYPYGATNFFGQPLKPGDIAVDPSVIPLGTKLRVCGYTSPILPPHCFTGVANDEGNAIVGRHIDIFIAAPDSVVNTFGIQSVRVTVLGN